MNFASIERACQAEGLSVFAAFHPDPNDKAPEGSQTLLMLGPKEPGFWALIKASPEFDSADPVDHWSKRVINDLAKRLNAEALFPFGGPPYQPFISWSLRSGRVWQSPVSLMIGDEAGLFLSFRGALAFKDKLVLPENPAASPCDTCERKPCFTACPTAALTEAGYDVPACHAFLDLDQGKPCYSGGCLVRRSCPVSKSYGRLTEQSAHHMRHFHKKG